MLGPIVPWSVAGTAIFVVGALIVIGTASSVIRTLIVTRGLNSIIARTLQLIPATILRFIARNIGRTYERRDAIQSWIASLSIVSMLLGWLILFLFGYTLMLYGTSGLDFWDSMRQAGSSLFTLGFASGYLPELTVIDFIAAATGPIVIGLMIGYLPTLYAAYNRREVVVSLLKSRAGTPSWGPELLARAAIVRSLDDIPQVWKRWEEWAADVAESHSTYPILIFTRSARPNRSWLIGLLSVLDAAALSLALNPHQAQLGQRLLLRQGVECFRDVAIAAKVDIDTNLKRKREIELTYEEYLEGVATLDAGGYPHERTAEEAWPYFRQWRSVYEEPAYKLAMLLDCVPAKWSGPRRPPTEQMPPQRPHYVLRNPDGSIDLTH